MNKADLFAALNFHNPDLMPNDCVVISLTILSGLLWTIAYINIIYRGFKDKTAGMPLLVLGLNIAWEFLFAFIFTMQLPVQRVVNAVWFLFDVVIVYLKFKYGRDEFNASLPGAPKNLFYPQLIVVILFSFVAIFSTVWEWNDYQGASAAYIMNVFISSLFIAMLFRKGSTAGQSMYIAISKCLGTVAPDFCGAYAMIKYVEVKGGYSFQESFKMLLDPHLHPLMKSLILMCFIFDITYIVLLYKQFKKEGKNPWTRKPLNPVQEGKAEVAV